MDETNDNLYPEPEMIWNFIPKTKFLSSAIYLQELEQIIVNQSSGEGVKTSFIDIKTGKIINEHNVNLNFTTNDTSNDITKTNNDNYIKNFYPNNKDFYLKLNQIIRDEKKGIEIKAMSYNKSDIVLYNFIIDNCELDEINIKFFEELDLIMIYSTKDNHKRTISVYNLSNGEKKYNIPLRAYSRFIPYTDNNRVIVKDGSVGDLKIYDLVNGLELFKLEKGLVVKDFFIFNDKNKNINILTEEPFKFIQIDFSNKINCNLNLGESSKQRGNYREFKIIDFYNFNGNYFIVYKFKETGTSEDINSNNKYGIVSLDQKNFQELWNKDFLCSSFVQMKEVGNDIIIFDDQTLYRLEKMTGKEIWKQSIENIKFLSIKGDNIIAGLGFKSRTNLSKNLGLSGFVKVDIWNGSKIWEFKTKSTISQINKNNDILYFSDTDNVYAFDLSEGKIKSQFNIKNNEKFKKDKISGTYYFQDRNQMLIITNLSVILFDCAENKILNSNQLICDYFLYHIDDYQDKILLTTFAGSEGRGAWSTVFTGKIILYLIDPKNGNVIWAKHIGGNSKLKSLAFFDYAFRGISSISPFINFNTCIKNNIFIIARYSTYFFENDTLLEVEGYKLFESNEKISDINLKQSFGVSYNAIDPRTVIERERALSVFVGIFGALASGLGSALGGAGGMNLYFSGSYLFNISFDRAWDWGRMLIGFDKFFENYYKSYYNFF